MSRAFEPAPAKPAGGSRHWLHGRIYVAATAGRAGTAAVRAPDARRRCDPVPRRAGEAEAGHNEAGDPRFGALWTMLHVTHRVVPLRAPGLPAFRWGCNLLAGLGRCLSAGCCQYGVGGVYAPLWPSCGQAKAAAALHHPYEGPS